MFSLVSLTVDFMVIMIHSAFLVSSIAGVDICWTCAKSKLVDEKSVYGTERRKMKGLLFRILSKKS